MLWRRFDITPLTSGPYRAVSSRAEAPRPGPTGGFDKRCRLANPEGVMPFDATLNRGLLRAGNLIAGK